MQLAHAVDRLPTSPNVFLPIDSFPDLSPDQALSLRVAVHEFMNSRARLGNELIVLTIKLCEIEAILKDRFVQFAVEQLQLQRRDITRFLRLGKFMQEHLADETGKVNVRAAGNITQQAFNALISDGDTEIIESIKGIAQTKDVTLAMVKQLLEERDKSTALQLESQQIESAAALKEMRDAAEGFELEARRMAARVANSEEAMARLQEQRTVLEEENRELKSRPETVSTEEVEILPAGYSTRQAAIEAIQEQLVVQQTALDVARKDLEAVNAKAAQVKAELVTVHGNMEQFLTLKQEINRIMGQYPTALVTSLSDADPKIKQSIGELGRSLVAMGNQLLGAN